MSQIYRLVCPIISKRNIESIYIYSESQSNGFIFSWLHVDGRARGTFSSVARLGCFWGSDRVARLGYLLRTFRPCCQIGLPFEDVQKVLPDRATFWGRSAVLLLLQLLLFQLLVLLIKLLLLSDSSTISASTTTFRFFYYFSFYYYFQILQINSFYIYALQLLFSFQHSHAFSAGNAFSSYSCLQNSVLVDK